MKRGLLILGILLLMVGVSNAADYQRLGLNSTTYTWAITVDTSDTAADGTLPYADTVFSDTFDLDTNFGYVNMVYYLQSLDTGSVLDDDSTLDLIIAEFFTGFGSYSPSWMFFADSFTDIPCTTRYHMITDTMVAREIYVRTRIIDTLNPSANDTNTISGWIDVLGGGSR